MQQLKETAQEQQKNFTTEDGLQSARSSRSIVLNGAVHNMVPMPGMDSHRSMQMEGGKSDAPKRTVTLTTDGIINDPIRKTKDGRMVFG